MAQTEKHKLTYLLTCIHPAYIHTDMHIYKHTYINIQKFIDAAKPRQKTYRQIGKQTDRLADKRTDRQTNRQISSQMHTGRPTDTERETDRQTCSPFESRYTTKVEYGPKAKSQEETEV